MANGVAGGSGSGQGGTLDVARFLGDLPFTRFHIQLLVICSLVTFFDGLDFSLIAFTLPYLETDMSLSEDMLGFVSSAAFLGQMIGSLIGSYLADIYGRRPVIIWCTILSALLTFLTGFANTPEMLIALRLVGGLAIGGLLAPAWSINIESMPAGKKATAVTIIMLGFSAGGAAAGQVTNFLVDDYGWQGVFFACGAATGLLAILLYFVMPESARWMVAKGKSAAEVLPALARFEPGVARIGYTEVTLSDERDLRDRESPWAKFMELFRGTLVYITPIIWFTYFCSSFAIYLKSSFGVLFLTRLGVDAKEAANIGSITGITGAILGVLLLMATERRGPGWIAVAPLLGVPAALFIGLGLFSAANFIPTILFGGILIGAGHAAVISLTSIYYPSAVRATGGGWASFMAKFAAVAAPLLASQWFLANREAVLNGYVFTGICLGGVVLGLILLAHFARRLRAEQDAEALVATADPLPAGASA